MWSAHKAAVHARQHAGQYSQKRCAEFVSKSIRAGGANLQNTHYAKDMKSNLIWRVSTRFTVSLLRAMWR